LSFSLGQLPRPSQWIVGIGGVGMSAPAHHSTVMQLATGLAVVDVIAAACENREGISTALRKARQKGIKVVTYDADALADAREFFVNQATPEGIGNVLMDECARLIGSQGEYAIITASLTAGNMIEWQKQLGDSPPQSLGPF